jgi:hypothetical protein
MKKVICLVVAIFVLFFTITIQGYARDGGHFHGGGHFSGSIWIGPGWGGWGPWWGPPYYPYYPYYPGPPAVIQQQPPVYVEPAPQEQYYWYFCQDPQGYYPYIKKCPKGWLKVIPPAPPEE